MYIYRVGQKNWNIKTSPLSHVFKWFYGTIMAYHVCYRELIRTCAKVSDSYLQALQKYTIIKMRSRNVLCRRRRGLYI